MRELIRWLLHPVVLGGAFVIALLLLAITLSLLWFTRPSAGPAGPATAVVNVIRAATVTPHPSPTPPVLSTPTGEVPPSPLPGVIGVGAYVQVTGTGGDGLRLRSEPGLAAAMRLLGSEAEVFQVQEGPREVDGYTWWYLVGPYDESRYGWAVANFLAVVQNP